MVRSPRRARSPRPALCGRWDRLRSSDVSRKHGADLGLGYRAPRHLRLAAEPPHVLLSGDLAHVIFHGVTGHHGLAELGLVDGQEVNLLVSTAAELRQHANSACSLRHALDQQHARKYRVAGKMPGELRLVEGDVLDAYGRFIAADLDNAIHHQKRIAMRQGFEDHRDVGILEHGRWQVHHACPRLRAYLPVRQTKAHSDRMIGSLAPARGVTQGIALDQDRWRRLRTSSVRCERWYQNFPPPPNRKRWVLS